MKLALGKGGPAEPEGGGLCCTDKGLLNFHMEAAVVEWDLTPAALLVLWPLS